MVCGKAAISCGFGAEVSSLTISFTSFALVSTTGCGFSCFGGAAALILSFGFVVGVGGASISATLLPTF
ncbi:hypothetical protein D3C80_1806750 [compost metagenome]